MKNKACFLDRDGVINVEVSYLHEADKVVLENGVIEALQLLQHNGFKLIVVTNQSGVARGMYQESDVEAVHQRISTLLKAHNIVIDKFYYCPHHEDIDGDCGCRKPEIGMFMQAVKEFNIDTTQSFMVGDRLSDIHAGQKANCRDSILVRCGYGEETIKKSDCSKLSIAENLLDAVKRYIIVK